MAHLWEPLPALWKPLAVHAGAEAMRAVTCAALRALGFRASRCQVRGGRAALAASVWAEGAAARALTCCRSCRGCWPRGVACAVHSGQVAASAHTADEFLFKFSLGAAHVKVRWQTAIQLPVCIVMCQNALGWVLGWWYCHNTDVASGVEAAVRLTCARKLLSASRGGGVSALLIAYVLTALLLVRGTGIGSGCQRGRTRARPSMRARLPACTCAPWRAVRQPPTRQAPPATCRCSSSTASAWGWHAARALPCVFPVPQGATVSAPQAAPSRPSGQSAARRMGKTICEAPPPHCTSAQESLRGRRCVVHHAG